MMPLNWLGLSAPGDPRPGQLQRHCRPIDIADLCRWTVFPNQCDWRKVHLLELPFRYPFLKKLIISPQKVEANHVSGYTQVIPLRW